MQALFSMPHRLRPRRSGSEGPHRFPHGRFRHRVVDSARLMAEFAAGYHRMADVELAVGF